MRTYFLLFLIFSMGLNGQNIVTSTRSTVSALVTINSKVFEITKIIKNEENNPELSSLIKCIKKGKERIGGYQVLFNSYYDCVINF